eukprot:Gregarina_sp_Poly_1__6316@NODE_335_length_9444_cov_64_484270_g283_i0_p1_GENE_NODE_335_length_9444_cov_64_484270_g283_i0NODE_335_length_9444_cov_64_484270_g283_i0_p1_ORF_typecomplete_len512_score73_07DUF4447/PF14590_6/0_12_NODE_335_length_9444_cov_64_484270_g283_i018083343
MSLEPPLLLRHLSNFRVPKNFCEASGMSNVKFLIRGFSSFDAFDQNGKHVTTCVSAVEAPKKGVFDSRGNLYELSWDGRLSRKSPGDLFLATEFCQVPNCAHIESFCIAGDSKVFLCKGNVLVSDDHTQQFEFPEDEAIDIQASPAGNFLMIIGRTRISVFAFPDLFNQDSVIYPISSHVLESITAFFFNYNAVNDIPEFGYLGDANGNATVWSPSGLLRTIELTGAARGLDVADTEPRKPAVSDAVSGFGVLGRDLWIALRRGKLFRLHGFDTPAQEIIFNRCVEGIYGFIVFQYVGRTNVVLETSQGHSMWTLKDANVMDFIAQLSTQTALNSLMKIDDFHSSVIVTDNHQIKIRHNSLLQVSRVAMPRQADYASYHPMVRVSLSEMPLIDTIVDTLLRDYAAYLELAVFRTPALEQKHSLQKLLSRLRDVATELLTSTCPKQDWGASWESSFDPTNHMEAQVVALLEDAKTDECLNLLLQNEQEGFTSVKDGIRKWFSLTQRNISIRE